MFSTMATNVGESKDEKHQPLSPLLLQAPACNTPPKIRNGYKIKLKQYKTNKQKNEVNWNKKRKLRK